MLRWASESAELATTSGVVLWAGADLGRSRWQLSKRVKTTSNRVSKSSRKPIWGKRRLARKRKSNLRYRAWGKRPAHRARTLLRDGRTRAESTSACEVRVRDHPRAPDQDRRARDRACRAHPRPAAHRVARTRRCSGVSHSASCRQAHKPRGCVPRRAADTADQPRTRCITSCFTPISPDGTSARVRSPDMQKSAA